MSSCRWQRPGGEHCVERTPAQRRTRTAPPSWGHSLHSWCPRWGQSHSHHQRLQSAEDAKPRRQEGSQRHRGLSVRLAWDSRYPPIRFYCPHHMKETQDPCGERQQHRWPAQNELGRNFKPSAEQGLKPWSRSLCYQLTACVPELRTLTVDTMLLCYYLQNLLSMSISFSSSCHNSTAPGSEATRIPLSPIQVRLATLASVWTPAKQKPSLGGSTKRPWKAWGGQPSSGHSG